MIAMFNPLETTVARPQVRVQIDIWKKGQVALGIFPQATEPMVVDLTVDEVLRLTRTLNEAALFARDTA